MCGRLKTMSRSATRISTRTIAEPISNHAGRARCTESLSKGAGSGPKVSPASVLTDAAVPGIAWTIRDDVHNAGPRRAVRDTPLRDVDPIGSRRGPTPCQQFRKVGGGCEPAAHPPRSFAWIESSAGASAIRIPELLNCERSRPRAGRPPDMQKTPRRRVVSEGFRCVGDPSGI